MRTFRALLLASDFKLKLVAKSVKQVTVLMVPNTSFLWPFFWVEAHPVVLLFISFSLEKNILKNI